MTDHVHRRGLLRAGSAASLATLAGPVLAARPRQIVWTFDRLKNIGGVTTHVEGDPQVIDSPLGKAVLFNGVDDGLFIDQHPLAGAATFTLEALFRPDGGAFAQRWMHLASDEPPPPPGVKPLNTRFLFEIRVENNEWWLDAFVTGQGYNKTLIFPDKRFPVGVWHHVTQTYDGKTYRSFVNGQLQGEGDIDFKPQGPGKSSVGARINRVNYFKGAIRQARFTAQALPPEAFLKSPV